MGTEAVGADGTVERSVALVVLAAGRSRRMKGRHKLLLPFPLRPIVQVTAQVAIGTSLGPVGVVVESGDGPIARALEGLPVARIENPRAAEGVSTSVSVATGWGFAHADAVVLLLADEPEVDPSTISGLVESWRREPGPAVRVRYRDRLGHPVLLTATFLEGGPLEGDVGLSARLVRGDSREFRVDRMAPIDIDTKAEYEAALARLTH